MSPILEHGPLLLLSLCRLTNLICGADNADEKENAPQWNHSVRKPKGAPIQSNPIQSNSIQLMMMMMMILRKMAVEKRTRVKQKPNQTHKVVVVCV